MIIGINLTLSIFRIESALCWLDERWNSSDQFWLINGSIKTTFNEILAKEGITSLWLLVEGWRHKTVIISWFIPQDVFS